MTLMVIWYMFTWPYDFKTGVMDWQALGLGVIASLITSILLVEVFTKHPHKLYAVKRWLWFIYYIPFFFYYCLMANLDVVYRVVHPKMPIKPGIVKVKTKLTNDSALTFLANSITLTPGTLTVDLTDDGYLYIHWINVKSVDIEEATKLIVEQFEKILSKIFE